LLFLDPGSGMGKNQDLGSGINIPDPQHCWTRIKRECDSTSSPYSDTFPPATINRVLKGKSQEKVCWSRIRGECDSISSPCSDFLLRQVSCSNKV
jgi:hypothetical protein